MTKTKEELVDFLKYITEIIEKNDSFEGRFEYHLTENNEFDCDFAIRYGNLFGQGGVLIP